MAFLTWHISMPVPFPSIPFATMVTYVFPSTFSNPSGDDDAAADAARTQLRRESTMVPEASEGRRSRRLQRMWLRTPTGIWLCHLESVGRVSDEVGEVRLVYRKGFLR